MFLTFFETRWFVYHSSLELFWQPLKEGCSLETWNRVSQFRHRLKGVVSDVLKRTKLQCHLGQEKQLPSLSLPSPLACGAFGSFLFLGCVPSLVLVDLFLVTVASGEKRRSSDVHLGVGVEQVPFFWHCSELSNCGVATTVCACVWRGDFMEALIWVHTRCTWVYVFHISERSQRGICQMQPPYSWRFTFEINKAHSTTCQVRYLGMVGGRGARDSSQSLSSGKPNRGYIPSPVCENKAVAVLDQLQEGRPALIQEGGAMLIAIVLDKPLPEAQSLVDNPKAFLQEITQVLADKAEASYTTAHAPHPTGWHSQRSNR